LEIVAATIMTLYRLDALPVIQQQHQTIECLVTM